MASLSWNYRFTFNGFADNFTIITDATPNSSGDFAALGIFGTFGGQAITRLDTNFVGPDNLLGLGASFLDGVDRSGVSFDTASGNTANIANLSGLFDVIDSRSGGVETPTFSTASVFRWTNSFTLNGFTDSFTIITNTTPVSSGHYAAIGIFGTFGGKAITGLDSSFGGPDNLLSINAGFVNGVDQSGVSFGLADGSKANYFASTNGSNYVLAGGSNLPVTPTFSTDAACFCAGTRIATPQGGRAVETLRAGDAVLTAAGVARKVRWMGHRSLRCANHPRPEDVHPVRIRAGAFGRGLPMRDLWLSPDHSVFADGCLIQASLLVNGRNVVQEAVASVQYWHVELDTHDVILAEGLPAETYLDTGNRSQFANAPVAAMHPDFRRVEMEVAASLACAPIVTGGAVLEAVRSWLAETADMDSERAA